MLSAEDVKAALPAQFRNNVTDELVNQINSLTQDPETAEMIRENFVSYSNVLLDGRFKIADFINAVTYVSYRLMEFSRFESYKRTFPDRYTALVARGATEKEISSYVAAYNKNRLVNLILEQTLIPTWVLNQHVYQQAINEQARLMTGAKSELVRTQAANSILTHLKKPDKIQVEMNLGVQEHAGMEELRNTLTQLAQQQKELIEQGVPTREVAHTKLVEGEAIEIDPETGDPIE